MAAELKSRLPGKPNARVTPPYGKFFGRSLGQGPNRLTQLISLLRTQKGSACAAAQHQHCELSQPAQGGSRPTSTFAGHTVKDQTLPNGQETTTWGQGAA